MSTVAPQDLLAHVDQLAAAFGDSPRLAGARYEVFLPSSGAGGALIDASPATAAPFARAVTRLGTGYQRSLLHAVLAGVPARRRVLKWGTNGALSVFHAVDVPARDLPRLAAPFDQARAATGIRDAVGGLTGLRVCGWAIEVPGSGHAARLRFYAMVTARDGLQPVLGLANQLSLDASACEGITERWQHLAGECDVVVNVEVARRASMKLEFPDVAVAHALLHSPTITWHRMIVDMASRAGTERLTHLGVRWTVGRHPQLCAYLPAMPGLRHQTCRVYASEGSYQ